MKSIKYFFYGDQQGCGGSNTVDNGVLDAELATTTKTNAISETTGIIGLAITKTPNTASFRTDSQPNAV
ncbi:MAG: hypothetical protein IAX21_08265 [Candidatus Bathyarchaeota archaeon]|nr:hypothetical protein [Candidatus Bathyarchaeum tardum]WGM89117.1 MAG: hypothetical protein NUK63_09410 [Candidatus Bathyarchaeum tardum]WNZ28643.1 MAG: hypothetical protein IAX21_08265 [Candidatus Bathyarchaeota archaeon]